MFLIFENKLKIHNEKIELKKKEVWVWAILIIMPE